MVVGHSHIGPGKGSSGRRLVDRRRKGKIGDFGDCRVVDVGGSIGPWRPDVEVVNSIDICYLTSCFLL